MYCLLDNSTYATFSDTIHNFDMKNVRVKIHKISKFLLRKNLNKLYPTLKGELDISIPLKMDFLGVMGGLLSDDRVFSSFNEFFLCSCWSFKISADSII